MNRGPPNLKNAFIFLAHFDEYNLPTKRKLLTNLTAEEEVENIMKLRITRTDLLKSKVIEPGWYPCEIVKVDEHPSKAGDSQNWDIYLQVLAPESVAGVQIIRTFSEKAPGFAVEFIAACGGEIKEDGGDFEMQAATGKKISVHVINEMYNGTMRNKADSFRPM